MHGSELYSIVVSPELLLTLDSILKGRMTHSKFRVLLLQIFISVIGPTFLSVAQSPGLFDSEEVFTITLSGNLTELLNDRKGDPQYFPVTMNYTEYNGKHVSIGIKARTRGNFRRAKQNCGYPPLLLNLSKDETHNTIFNKQDKLKLVTPCRDDKYVIREYLVYKVYNLFTPKSFRARLVKVILEDPDLKLNEPFYGILLEEEDQMAARNNLVSVERKLVRPEETQIPEFLIMSVFEYMIGNTDWSVQYRQNVKLMGIDTLQKPYTVPYDFDHAGIVGAPYAKPAEALMMTSTKQRRYRGFCISDMIHYEKTIEQFNALKDAIYAVYLNNPLLDAGYIKSTVKYLDDFYKTINDPKRVKLEFQYPCREDGTGNVVIKGLKND